MTIKKQEIDNNVPYNNENDQYPEFEASLKIFFNNAIGSGEKLFKTNAVNLFEAYLDNLPAEARQHYNCNACRHFIERFGNLVFIDEKGNIKSAMWDENIVPVFFKDAVSAMQGLVEAARVTGVFLSEEKRLGIPKTGEWKHLAVEIPREMQFRSRLQSSGQAMSEKREEYGMLSRALANYSLDVVDQALALIQTETLYRSDKVEGIAKWLKNVIEKRNATKNSRSKENIVWLEVANAPTGFTHINSSMIGTLLEDIASGMSARLVSARFAEKMNPANYMRSQSAPSANAILEAEKTVEKLGIANSLQRRFAKIEEVPTFLWKDTGATKPATEKKAGGVFGSITPKEKLDNPSNVMALPSTVMTWDKFQRTVLPTADSLEVLTDNTNRFMALVTAVDQSSENILQWDNTFSWYYHGGVDAEVKRRVENAGGRYENNEIRVSLIWDGYTDLDLHAITPRREHIFYGHPRGVCGGWLDIDMNGGSHRNASPVENIRWERASEGHYQFYVHNFVERGKGTTPFKLELEINGQVYSYNGVAGGGKWESIRFTFDYVKGQQPVINGFTESGEAWNVPANSFVKVNGITNSPNLWNEQEVSHAGTHVFFLLDGVKDSSEGKGRGFFNEMLKPELRQIRKVLEAYTGNTPIEEADEATACGVGYSKDNEWGLTLRVTSNGSSRIIKIDRWD